MVAAGAFGGSAGALTGVGLVYPDGPAAGVAGDCGLAGAVGAGAVGGGDPPADDPSSSFFFPSSFFFLSSSSLASLSFLSRSSLSSLSLLSLSSRSRLSLSSRSLLSLSLACYSLSLSNLASLSSSVSLPCICWNLARIHPKNLPMN